MEDCGCKEVPLYIKIGLFFAVIMTINGVFAIIWNILMKSYAYVTDSDHIELPIYSYGVFLAHLLLFFGHLLFLFP